METHYLNLIPWPVFLLIMTDFGPIDSCIHLGTPEAHPCNLLMKQTGANRMMCTLFAVWKQTPLPLAQES